ncbi:hypothetical protein ROLI_026370 [Roseobacter fucihabitans]|uniref:DUF484 family protein n=1 Tax=Roseobacter fucihabitans TaxID=1537242 RepID=A0ABZ2BWJ4_9RHOB|nr:DUF484 family protein [Roseobacter litoralis]MBC6965700.1 hypothetical protein [Roseobacter litoralis]
MSSTPKIEDALREAIMSRPDVILEDSDVMKALIAANDRSLGDNIVDLRGIAMARMENQLDRLENTHRSVIAAAYENLAGTQQIHRAILRMMEPETPEGFLHDLGGEIGDILRVDGIKLVLDSGDPDGALFANTPDDVLRIGDAGFINTYLGTRGQSGARKVILRQIQGGTAFIYGEKAEQMQSEACLTLDLGGDMGAGLLVLASCDPLMFAPQQGTDLLDFLASAAERILRRWLV